MHKSVYNYLGKHSKDTDRVDRLIVSAFLSYNNLKPQNNQLLRSYNIEISHSDEQSYLDQFIESIKKDRQNLVNEDLIELFEFVISPSDKDVNGAVYTPENIRTHIVNATLLQLANQNVDIETASYGDISCGCGGFFYTLTEILKLKTGKTCAEIFRDNIFGLDIEEYSIKRTKLLLSILALLHGEDEPEYQWNLFVGDALKFNWIESCEKIRRKDGFQAILGNPPYVGAVKLDSKTKEELKKWEVSKIGKADLYTPFFQIGLELLVDKGVLGFISVNSFYKSLNGVGLRKYISNYGYDFQIVDFGGEQIFKGRTTYTCICLIQKLDSNKVNYAKVKSRDLARLVERHFVTIDYRELDDHKGWLLDEAKITALVRKIEATGKPLSDCFDIRNGFATLRNNIYLIDPIKEDLKNYFAVIDNKEFHIEKEVCKPAIKPNILKTENDIKEKLEHIIFPYHLKTHQNSLFNQNKKHELSLFEEDYFKEKFPGAYEYLKYHKVELAKRDNGNKIYQRWFAYGRNQGLTFTGKKLLFPYISDHPYFVFTDNEELLFYNGFAVISQDETELRFIQKVLNSRLFWFYLSHVSRPYENNYYSMGKRYLARFGVYEFSEIEKNEIIALKSQEKIDFYLESKYEIILPKSYLVSLAMNLGIKKNS